MATKYNSRRRIHRGRLMFCVAIVIALIALVLYVIHSYNNPKLIGKWESEETQKTVTFHKDGTVALSHSNSVASFQKLTDHTLSYTIDNNVFDMYYSLEGRTLKWGMSENDLEIFKRK